jgi:flagella basal body P-ring formation protein FlgA
MILVWTGAAQAAGRLRILPAACAAGERVMLKEIAVPDPGFPEDAWAILGATALWAAPAPGQSSIVSQAELPGALRAHLREAPVEYQLPTQLLVRRGGRIMYRPELENLVGDFLTPHLAGLPGQASVAGVETPEYLFFGENDRVVVELAGSGATVGAGPVDLRLAVTEPDGRAASKVVARAVVRLMARVAVASRPVIHRDGVLTPELVSFEKRNVAGLKGAPWDGSGAVRLVRGMGQGQIVLADDVGAHAPGAEGRQGDPGVRGRAGASGR